MRTSKEMVELIETEEHKVREKLFEVLNNLVEQKLSEIDTEEEYLLTKSINLEKIRTDFLDSCEEIISKSYPEMTPIKVQIYVNRETGLVLERMKKRTL